MTINSVMEIGDRKTGEFANTMKSEGKRSRVSAKWGFGMAPISTRMRQRYDRAVQTVLDLLHGNIATEAVPLANLSEVKGMFNRCVKQDQWDWFSVYTEFGEPPLGQMSRIVRDLTDLRRSLLSTDNKSVESARARLIDNNLCQYLENYQLKINLHSISDDSGWIYILSTRQQPTFLKIGMTKRSVVQRVNEINAATGVVIPYSARGVFRVKQAEKTERDIHALLNQYRIRSDREFFELAFGQAVRLIQGYIEESRLRARQHGRIVWFNHHKYYGFIATSKHKDVFVHSSDFKGCDPEILKPGMPVEFDLGSRPKGPCALRVRIREMVD